MGSAWTRSPSGVVTSSPQVLGDEVQHKKTCKTILAPNDGTLSTTTALPKQTVGA